MRPGATTEGECALRTTSVTAMQVIFVPGMQAGLVAEQVEEGKAAAIR